MKRIWLFAALAALSLVCCTKENDVDKTQEEVDGLKGSKIATVQNQVSSIRSSIGLLETADTDLKSLISTLQSKLAGKTGAGIEAAINSLNAVGNADAALAQRISDLNTYCSKLEIASSGWIAGSFTTLEKQSATLLELFSLKLRMAELEAALGKVDSSIAQSIAAAKKKVQDEIDAAEASIKNWINKEINGYYTIAEFEAKLALLEQAAAGAEGDISDDLAQLRQDLTTIFESLTTAYKSGISNAITANRGVINDKIATSLETANDAVQPQIDALLPRLTGLESRVAALEDALAGLVGGLDSIIVVPEYTDGSVMIEEGDAISLKFEVYPLSIASELAGKGVSAFSLDYVDQSSGSPLFSSIPVTGVSFENGLLTISANGSNLPEEVKLGDRDINVRLRISNGTASCSSDYFRMFYKRQSIFRDDLFEMVVDQSGVKSYLLKSGLGDDNWDCSQSNYFNTRSMTNDERFLFFFGSNKDFVGADNQRRVGMIIDLQTRQMYKISGCAFSCCPYLDVENDVLYYGTVVNNKTGGEFYRRDLLVDPSVAIPLATLPSYLIPTNKTRPLQLLATHLTLTSDRQKALLDMHIHDSFVYGMINLYTGTFEEWGRTSEYQLNHGQINPTNDNMIMMAASSYTSREDGSTVSLKKDADGLYPRIQIATKTPGGNPVYNRYTMVPDISSDRDGGYASHERWDESGQYVYFCSSKPCIRALSEARNMSPSSYTKYATPSNASHCFFSTDRKYITYDDQSPDYYRSCRWKVNFYNIKTKKEIKIHTLLPALVPKADVTAQDGDSDEVKTAKSKLAQAYQNWHTDPHPQFNCNDKYIICTAQRSDKTIRLSITPVDQLLELTK